MLFTKPFFALVAAVSIVNATITCTVDVTTSPPVPSYLATLVADVADSAIAAALAGSTVSTSSSVTDTGGVIAFTISVSDPGVPDSTLIRDLNGKHIGPITITILGTTYTLEISVSNCHS